jgi:hypothetical protein
MEIDVIDKKVELSLLDMVRFQLTVHCFIKGIKISPAQLKTLAYLSIWGEMNFSDFCIMIQEKEIFGNTQTVRNFILLSVREGYVIRKGKGKKLIELSDDIELVSEGNILLNLKAYHVTSQES